MKRGHFCFGQKGTFLLCVDTTRCEMVTYGVIFDHYYVYAVNREEHCHQ